MPLTRDLVFNRVIVDHLVRGSTRISWQLYYAFLEPGPYLFSVEVGHTGAPGATDWVPIGAPMAGISSFIDPGGQRDSGTNPVTHYRVVLTTGIATHRSEPQSSYGVLAKSGWLDAREIVRSFELYQRMRRATSGVLYKRMREGPGQPASEASDPRTAVLDPLTGGVRRRCKQDIETFGTGFLGGYYASFPLRVAFDPAGWFEDVGPALSEGNVDPQRTARTGRCLMIPPLAYRDVYVAAGSDLRYEVASVQVVAAVGDVPLIGDVTFRFFPFEDVVFGLDPAPEPPTVG